MLKYSQMIQTKEIKTEEIGEITAHNAEILALSPGGIDFNAAELTLRSLAVITIRLSHDQFNELSKETQDSTASVVKLCQYLAPENPKDRERYALEPEKEYYYRVNVYDPLFSLQAAISLKKVGQDATDQALFRTSLLKAGKAFKAVLSETKDLPSVAERKSYFWKNAITAASLIKKNQI